MAETCIYFRGSRAAAPLKAADPAPSRSAAPDFRGSRAAAPLKVSGLSNGGGCTGYFRGSRAAAPLKVVVCAVIGIAAPKFPRLTSRGPIEGGEATLPSWTDDQISAAHEPRPH